MIDKLSCRQFDGNQHHIILATLKFFTPVCFFVMCIQPIQDKMISDFETLVGAKYRLYLLPWGFQVVGASGLLTPVVGVSTGVPLREVPSQFKGLDTLPPGPPKGTDTRNNI
ncbi:hypothetical protein PoB_003446800 [Plakobranchus ocellatus]|uniref:Uncharacterized protein n=1 Tax=Plakobranchus ocellatus TaxID=259542 RepID=A0AAV4AN06_9GAST|nr:hypothetical protein PoB_003446800 [Plakobranchus ocellatus]